jgi:hypothetical protein
VEVLKKNIPNKLALMGRSPGLAFAREKSRRDEQASRVDSGDYLNNSLLELNETAYSSSFVRAFRAWEGVPPAHWRGAQ